MCEEEGKGKGRGTRDEESGLYTAEQGRPVPKRVTSRVETRLLPSAASSRLQ